MEREKELAKLINVLRRTGRMAMHSEWTGSDKDGAAHCAGQYNRVLARLKELDPDIGNVFEPLATDSPLGVTAMACRQLAAYYEDEVGHGQGFGKAYAFAFDPQHFKEFWQRAGKDIEDLGEFIRESINEWVKHKRPTCETKEDAKP
jgi:hypothetical protein